MAQGPMRSNEAGDSQHDVHVDVFGKRYVFRSAFDAEHVERVAGYLNEVADNIRYAFPTAKESRIIVLTAMQIAHELLALRDEHSALEQRLERESARLLSLVEGQ